MLDVYGPIRVLVVDDSPVSRKLVEYALEGEPCKLLFARSGDEALRIFAESRPQVVITDWMMPDLCGPDLCMKIREQSVNSYTYIILLTSSSEMEKLIEGLAAGADDYLTKPFHQKELVARIGVGRRIIAMQRDIETKNRQLEEAARTDPLTGLPNRRAVEEYGHKQLAGAIRNKYPFWVVAADLDEFKAINDTYGHAAGDVVLRSFAALLKDNTRASDMCGRFGGDEFVLLVSHIEKKYVPVVVNRLRESFAGCEFDFDGNKTRVKASFGFAGCESELAKLEHLFAAADVALYQSKSEGRKRVRPATDASGEFLLGRNRA
jgi:two-component system chemotaxis response regulator CheY